MAKILLKEDPASLHQATVYGDEGDMEQMMWEIINGQNAQITLMQNWLRDNGHEAKDHCPMEYSATVLAPADPKDSDDMIGQQGNSSSGLPMGYIILIIVGGLVVLGVPYFFGGCQGSSAKRTDDHTSSELDQAGQKL